MNNANKSVEQTLTTEKVANDFAAFTATSPEKYWENRAKFKTWHEEELEKARAEGYEQARKEIQAEGDS